MKLAIESVATIEPVSRSIPVPEEKARHRAQMKKAFTEAVVFSDLPAELRQSLLQVGCIRTYQHDETIFWKGDTCTHFYFLLRGLVKMVHSVETGKEFIDFLVPAGHTLDQLAIFDALPFHFTADAQEPSDVLLVAREQGLGLMDRFPALHQKLVSDLAASHRALSHRMFDLSATSVERRIAQTIFTLVEELNIDVGASTHVELAFTRQEISELVGSSPETVSRVLGRWRKQKLVTLAAGSMTVNLVKLARI